MYEEHFGLSRKPFQLSPDARFFFPSAEHRRALSFLQYGLSQGDGFIVITGNVGTGKTTLVQALLQDLDESELAVATIVTSNLKEDELLHMVAENFGISTRAANKASLLKAIEHNFVQQARANRRILLIVDEAQNLPERSVEELRMLSNFQLDGQPLVQIFLLGQQEFRTTLLSQGFEQLRQRIIATYHLNPLDEAETRTYIEHRLNVAGWADHPHFEDEAFPAIYEFCEGVPRRINNLCDRLLLFSFLEELDVIGRSTVETVSNEIGEEFMGGLQTSSSTQDTAFAQPTPARDVFDSPEPLESAARSMFDKADLQKRIFALERAVDSLGHSLKPEMTEIRQELAFIRVMLDELVQQGRAQSVSKKKAG
jgi:putative secretion ATPase (PEP-CTERM system associated)